MIRPLFSLIRTSLCRVEDQLIDKSVDSDVGAEFTLDVILKFAFGASVEDPAGQTIRSGATELLQMMMWRFMVPAFLWTTPLWRLFSLERKARNVIRVNMVNTVKKLMQDASSDKSPFLQSIGDSGMELHTQITNAEVGKG